jgi:hypothetical protein
MSGFSKTIGSCRAESSPLEIDPQLSFRSVLSVQTSVLDA